MDRDFCSSVVADYHAARHPVVADPKLSRGTARVVASLAEDRLALALVRRFPRIGHIHIDQPLRLEGCRLCRPDLVVERDGEVVLLVDLKMDLGWLRDGGLRRLAVAASELLANGRGRDCVTAVRTGGPTRQRRVLRLSPACEYVLLVVSGRNIAPALRRVELDAVKPLEERGVHALVLWPDVHPNDPIHATAEAAVEALMAGMDHGAVARLHAVCQRVLG